MNSAPSALHASLFGVVRLWLVAVLWLGCVCVASANDRVALVVGNSDYRAAPLVNPRNDANAMAVLLSKAGFQVDKQLDTNLEQLQTAVDRFGKAIRDPGVKFGLFYYAGHGLQQDWRNYLVPVSARIRTAAEVPQQTVDVSQLLRYMEQAQGRSFLVVLDACRDDPFAGAFRPPAKGLSQFDAPAGSLLAYATAPGNVARDGEGVNGLYTGYLLREFAVPGARLEDAFKRVRLSVRMASHGAQIPWESTSLEEDIYLFPLVSRHLSEADKDQLLEKEMTTWLRVKSSTDPEVLANFIREYPSSSASELAQSRMNRMLAAMAAQENQRVQAEKQKAEQAAKELAAAQEEAQRRAAEAQERRLAAQRAEEERLRLAQAEAARAEERRQQIVLEAARLAEASRVAQEQARAAEVEAQRLAAARLAAVRETEREAQAAALERQREIVLQQEREARERELVRQAEVARLEQARLVQLQQQEAARLEAERQSAEVQEHQRQQVALAEERRLAAERVEQDRVRVAQAQAQQEAMLRQEAVRAAAVLAEGARLAQEKALAAEREAQRLALQQLQEAREREVQAQAAARDLQRARDLQAAREKQEQVMALQAEQARAELARKAETELREAQRLAAQRENVLAAASVAAAPVALEPTPYFKGYTEHQRNYSVGDEAAIRVIDLFSKASTPLVMKVTEVDEAAERVTFNGGEFVSDLMGNIVNNQRGALSTPRQFYPAELMVGKRWSTRFKQSRPGGVTYTFQYDLKVVGKERITVPAGSFDTYRIEARGFNLELGANLQRTIWVAPGVNADIAHEIKVRLRSGRWDQNDRQELVSYVQARR